MMTALSTIWALLRGLPQLLSILKDLAAFIHSLEDAAMKRAAVKELKEGVKDATQNRDPGKLNDLFGSTGQSHEQVPPNQPVH